MGKISSMQRIALDSIFAIIDRPSRGLVLHIAKELYLYHITVKNFFSNGRRRLRRAAARLNDPEKTRRENLRRKEKRRLTALAAAAYKDRYTVLGFESCPEGHFSIKKQQLTLSPERKALMDKLTVKIQKSTAQKALLPPFKRNGTNINDTKKQIKLTNSYDDISLATFFSANIHSNSNNSFHFYQSSQNKLFNETELNTFYHEFKNDVSSNYNTSYMNNEKCCSKEQIVEDEKSFDARFDASYYPTNWYSLI